MANQHSSKTYMFILKCLHEMDENVTHLFPLLEPSLTPSRMPKPSVRKHSFQNKWFFVLKNILPSFDKIYWTTLRGELLGNSLKKRRELLDNSSKKFFGKSSFEIPFTTIFLFLSCHALTPIFLGCLGAY